MKNTCASLVGAGALIVLLTVVAYLPILRGGFVFDDHELITDNWMVKASDGPYRFWFTAESPDYRPLVWSLWWLEWRLWDGRAPGYHVVNVLLFAVDTVMVWLILRRLKVAGAWLAAVIFAIHPVNVATGAWISEQKNTLSMLFYALAILLYLKFDDEGRWRWYGLSVGAFFLALLSKTAVVMLPVALLGCAWWRHGRVRTKDWLCSGPYFVGSLVLALVTIIQHVRTLPTAFVRPGSFAERLAMAGQVPWFYLSKALLPVDLMVVYPKWQIDASHWVSYVPGIILIGGLIVFWWKRNTWGRPVLFGLGYFVVTLFPVLGFFDQAFYWHTLVADHWQYHSIIGVIALVVAAGQKAVHRMSEWGRSAQVLVPLGAGLASVVLVAVLGVATWNRSSVYAKEATLWQDNVTKNPNAWVAHYNLGVDLKGMGRMREAIGHFEQTVRLCPDFAKAHINLGAALAHEGRIEEAVHHFERALQIVPHYAAAHFDWALALQHTGKLPEAVRHYELALRFDPSYVEAQNNLAWLLATLAPTDGGDPTRAVSLARGACTLTEYRVPAYLDTLAVAYAAAGRFAEATATARTAIDLARGAGQPGLAREIETRRQLYRAGLAYRPSVDARSSSNP
ncbi:MAG TPA: tetratricopeptide repeat protein [Verrucomicrobiae bacterium]|nr:tetratricopeptide repeat protein [Verrucomicrobiae bacterium]